MFKLFFKHRDRPTAAEQKLAMQREMEQRRKADMRRERALQANIASKLKSYNVDEDTTISQFTLAEEEVERNLMKKSSQSKSQDVWGQADPRESARWKKEDRIRKGKYR